jgi:hypothetical protein
VKINGGLSELAFVFVMRSPGGCNRLVDGLRMAEKNARAPGRTALRQYRRRREVPQSVVLLLNL